MKLLTATCCAAALTVVAGAGHASTVYLNQDNISVSVGAGTSPGTFNNTVTAGGFGTLENAIQKVIDAPSADAEEFHSQTSHIWYTAAADGGGLELLFDFGISYDISTLHFWNYTSESYDVDEVAFKFFNSLGELIGTETLFPALGSSGGIEAQDIALVSPLNTRSVTAFLTGSNRQVDFQNIGFTATVSDPDLDPDPSVVPLPAAGWLLLGGLGLLSATRRRR